MKREQQLFLQLWQLVEKERQHLADVEQRFFEGQSTLTLAWLQAKLHTSIGIDQLESFAAKFARLQDTLGDKVLPLFLQLAAEPLGTAIENLNRAEKLGLVSSTHQWLAARQLRNFLIHEYIDDLQRLLEALQQAQMMVPMLQETVRSIRKASMRIGILTDASV